MIIPHLLFAHLIGDYLLQTGWLAARKSQALDGLFLHTTLVFVMSVLMLAPYFDTMIWPLLVLYALHTLQDWLKVWIGPRLRIHLSIPYFLDQVGHVLVILGVQAWADIHHLITPAPDNLEIFLMSLGCALIFVTRFYEVTWWANWFEMIVYMSRWQILSGVERVFILLAATFGGLSAVWLVPFIALPRLGWSARHGYPLWRQKYGLLEWGLGVLLSFGIGAAVLHALWLKVG